MLKFPYKHIILFENEKTIEIKEDGSTFEPVENHVYMQNFSSVNKDRIIFMTEENDLFTDCRMPVLCHRNPSLLQMRRDQALHI